MRFTFLGTGTSAGIPAIGCDCAVCTSSDPRDNRLRTSGAVQFVDASGQPRVVLLDAGPDLRQQAIRFRLPRVDAILFTHNHVDHTFGLDEVRRFNVVQKTPIDVYADEHTMEHLRRVYKHIFEKDHNVNDSFVASLIAHRIKAGDDLDLFGLRVRPVRLLHGKLPMLGYRIDTPPNVESSVFPLAYCTDVSALPPETWRELTGVKTLVLDALRKRHHPTHLTLDQAIRIAEHVNADRTFFVHMAHDLGHAQTQAELPKGMFLAFDGLTLGGEPGAHDD
jgi:phosphoribosyl 1,2-cyclic phosphate phosphodiesterase